MAAGDTILTSTPGAQDKDLTDAGIDLLTTGQLPAGAIA